MCIGRAEREGGGQVLILGFSQANLARLLKGEPIQITREKHGEGVPEGWEILVMYGRTEENIQAQLEDAGAIGPHTRIHKDPTL